MSRWLAIAAAALLAVGGSPATAAEAKPSLREQLTALQALDARVQSVGWRLVRGNAAYCKDAMPAIGLLLQDAAGFDDPTAVRAALGLNQDIAVEAVAAGSPAARAGLSRNAGLRGIAGQAIETLPPVKSGDYARLTGLHDRIDAALARDGRIDLTLADGTRLTIPGEPACKSRFEMLAKGDRAAADGARVVIGRGLVEDLPEDELLAAALAHELAHNLLGHRARLDTAGRSWGKVRTTEREADRLSVWLLANAGYDPQAALRFFERWGPKHDHGIFSTPDHDRWRTRMKRIAAEIEALRAARAQRGGAADWPRDFTPAG